MAFPGKKMGIVLKTMPIILLGILLGFILLKIGGLSKRWSIAIAFTLLFLLIWPFYSRISGDPWKLLWMVLVISIPLEFNVHLVHQEYEGVFNGIMITLTDLAVVGLLVHWLYEIVIKRTGRVRFIPSITIPVILYFLAHLVSIVNTPDMTLSLYSIAQNSKVFLLYFIIANRIQTKTSFQFIAKLLMISLVIQSLVCIVQFILKTNFTTSSFEIVSNYGEEVFRVAGTTGSPNVTASFLASLLPLPIVLLIFRESRDRYLLPLASSLLGFTALLLSQTRGAWLTFMIGILIFLLFNLRKKNIWKFVAGFAVLLSLVLIVFGGVIIERFSEGSQTLEFRIQLIRSGLEMFRSRPVFGVGTNIYALVMADYVPFFLTQERLIVHNRYILTLAETGLTGLVFFLIFLGVVCRNLISGITIKDQYLSIFSWGLLIAFLVFAMQMIFETLAGRLCDSHVWLIAGLAAALKVWKEVHYQKESEVT